MPTPNDPTAAPVSPSRPRRLGLPARALVLAVGLAACGPDLADEADVDLATSTTTGDDESTSTAGISTVTGQTSSESDGSGRPPGELPPVIESFTLDGEAAGVTVDHAHTAVLEVVTADDPAIRRVLFFDGELPLATVDAPPFRVEWPIDDITAAAPRLLTAIAEDEHGHASAVAELPIDFAMATPGADRWRDLGGTLHAGEVRGVVRGAHQVIAVGVRGLDPEADETHAFLRFYDADDGTMTLSAAYPKPGTKATYRADAAAITPTGEVVVAGVGTPAEQATRPWIAVFSPSGSLLRERLDPVAGGEALAVAAGGDALYLAGHGADGLYFLRGLDLELATTWSLVDDDPTHIASEIRGLVRDEDGDLYAVGTVVGPAIPAQVLAARIAADGVVRWGGRIECEGIESDEGRAIALGDDGDLLIAAAMATSGGARVELRWLGAAAGEHRGVSLLPSTLAEGDEVPSAVAIDRRGRVYVSATATSPSGADAVVYKRSSDGGASMWERMIDGDEHGDDQGLGVAVGDDGVVYVGGSITADGWRRWWIQALEP